MLDSMNAKVTPEQMALIQTKNYLNVQEAAAFLGRSEKTVRNRINEIPHYYGPLGPMFKREELEAWLCPVKCIPQAL